MTNEQLLEKAKEKYPIGCLITPLNMHYIDGNPKEVKIQSCDFHFEKFPYEGSIWVDCGYCNAVVFDGVRWADIVGYEQKFELNEEVEVKFGDKWERCTYVGESILYTPIVKVGNGLLQGIKNDEIRKIKPKHEPEIGSLCLFSDTLSDYDNKIGVTGRFGSMFEEQYKDEDDYVWNFCRQIETLTFKDEHDKY